MNTKFTIHEHPAPYTYPGAVDYTFDCMAIADESTLRAALIPTDNPNWEKHLKLFAAAPELLEALKTVDDMLDEVFLDLALIGEIIHNAIKKATE